MPSTQESETSRTAHQAEIAVEGVGDENGLNIGKGKIKEEEKTQLQRGGGGRKGQRTQTIAQRPVSQDTKEQGGNRPPQKKPR